MRLQHLFKLKSREFLLPVLLIFVGLTLSCDIFKGEMPTDSQLIKTFSDHRNDFETLVKMSNEDNKVIRIAYDFTWVSDENEKEDSGKARPIGFSVERWEAYKKLFRNINLDSGISRSEPSNNVWFLAYSRGLATGGLTKGYIFSESGINCSSNSLDDLKTLPNDRFLCKNVEKNWYIFIER